MIFYLQNYISEYSLVEFIYGDHVLFKGIATTTSVEVGERSKRVLQWHFFGNRSRFNVLAKIRS